MPRLAYLVELDANNITYLAWAAGLAQGAGNEPAAAALQDIIDRVEAFEIPDEELIPPGIEAADYFAEQDEEVPELELVEDEPEDAVERDIDPNFPGPGAWGPPPAPMNNPADFGAGPPPSGAPR